MIIIWARGDRPCGIYLIFDSALRSSAQTRGDRPCRYMNLASPPWVMNFRCISEKYRIYCRESTWYFEAYHFMVSFCIAFHDIFHSWWLCILLVVEKYLIFDYLYSTNLILCVAVIRSAFFVKVVIVEYWVCSWGCANLLKWFWWVGCCETVNC